MTVLNLLLLSFGLSADAFAVSVTHGLCAHPTSTGQHIATAACFGLFQSCMPMLGYLAGQRVAVFVAYYAHWIALLLLTVLGSKMMVSAVMHKRHRSAPKPQFFSVMGLLIQAFATSIDALSIGIGYAILEEPILPDALCIGVVTFFCCLFGFSLGKRFGVALADKAMMAGGIILIFIGIHLFVSHYFPYM